MGRGMLVLAVLSALTWAAPAAAACNVDTDCPTATCGGQVCQWGASHTCVPAGTDPQGTDGWCSTSADCKCMGAGAVCNAPHCSFTLPQDAGSSGDASVGTSSSSSSSGSSSGSSGSSGGGSSSSGATSSSGSSSGGYMSSTGGGSYSSGGSSSGATSSSGAGGSSGALPDADVASGQTSSGNSGGCAVSAPSDEAGGTAIALMSVAALAFVRRRRA